VLAFEVDPAGVPNVVIITAAVIAALGVIWRKVVVPVRGWFRQFKAWMERVETAVTEVSAETRTNGGSTLRDQVNKLNESVAMLLEHDAERDTKGHRYGPDPKENP
jgi:hypothetical protein